MNTVDAADVAEGIVQVTDCPLMEHPDEALLMVNAESRVSDTVAAPEVATPVLLTVRVMAPGPPWKIGVEWVAEIDSEAVKGTKRYAASLADPIRAVVPLTETMLPN